ncbi:unnamed protein product [Rangifer tarandus platyrhynchus]|uniref:Uncharacterized protein n=1 Tax=Rangifer tarandus platyrhynchus TaxID=3082113 RepID=A0AC60A2R3_RANTA
MQSGTCQAREQVTQEPFMGLPVKVLVTDEARLLGFSSPVTGLLGKRKSSPARHLGLRGAGAPFPRSQARSSEPRRAPGMPKHDAEAQPSPGNTQPRAVLHPRGGPWPSQGSEESV